MTREWREAALRGNVDRIRALIVAGAEIDARDRYGQTALMLASRHGHAEVVRVLIARGADLNVTAKYRLTALMLAVLNRHGDIVRILVDAGADLRIRGTGAPGFHDKTAADLADNHGQPDLATAIRRAALRKERTETT